MATPQNVLWIGGTSGTGKSTVARLLARRHGLRWYSCDTRTWLHRDRAIASGDAAAIEWEQLTAHQRAELSTADAIRLTLDRSTMVLDDVAALADSPAVVAEGTNITPAMVPAGSLAVWLMARPETRAGRIRRRGWGAAGGELDLLQSQQLMTEVERVGAPVIDTSHHANVGETLAEIELVAATWLATRPTAQSRRERRSLIRQGNAAIVSQYRAGLARTGYANGDGPVRAYDCECADPACVAMIERPLGSLPDPFSPDAEPILAPGHHV